MVISYALYYCFVVTCYVEIKLILANYYPSKLEVGYAFVCPLTEKVVDGCPDFMLAKVFIITFIINNYIDDEPTVAWEKA